LNTVWLLYCLNPNSKALDEYFCLTYMCYGAQFLQAMHRMLVCDVTCGTFYPIRRTHLLVWVLLIANGLALFISEGESPLVDEQILLIAVNLISWGAVAHQIYYTI